MLSNVLLTLRSHAACLIVSEYLLTIYAKNNFFPSLMFLIINISIWMDAVPFRRIVWFLYRHWMFYGHWRCCLLYSVFHVSKVLHYLSAHSCSHFKCHFGLVAMSLDCCHLSIPCWWSFSIWEKGKGKKKKLSHSSATWKVFQEISLAH